VGHTIRRNGEVGGSMRIAMPSILTKPWNPLAAPTGSIDQMLIRGIGEYAYMPDPYTGLYCPSASSG
jgi:peptide/nickel transport system substrate-binding protein